MLTKDQFKSILDQVPTGKSVTSICKGLKLDRVAFYAYLLDNPETANDYARAIELRSHSIVDDITEITNTEENPAMIRAKVDSLKWYAGKLNGKYSDKQQIEHSGSLKITEVVEFGERE